MSGIAIVTDSNSGIIPEQGENMGIHIIPMPVIINGHTFYEEIDINKEEFYTYLEKNAEVSTSQPSPGELMDIWDALLKGYDEIVYIPMSSALSHSYQTAMILAQEDKFEGKVHVIDNKRISVTQAQSVMDAKYLAEQGYPGLEIKKYLEKNAGESSIYITVNNLEYLKRGGRITKAAAAVATTLNIKPILTIQGAKLEAYSKARGIKSAIKEMEKALENDLNTRFVHLRRNGELKIGIAYTMIEQTVLEKLYIELKEKYHDMEVIQVPLTMSIACHVGPGALGIGIVKYCKGKDNSSTKLPEC